MTDLHDAVAIEVHRKALQNVANEMAVTLVRTSGSPVVTDGKDFSTCLLDTQARQIGFSSYVLQHAASSWLGTQSVVEDLLRLQHEARPGDGWIVNDPHTGGALHQGDVGIIMPIFVGGKLAAWAFSNCHVVDVGGSGVSGINPAARSVFDEGLRFPPTRIISGGRLERPWETYIGSSVRVPDIVLNDIRSMIAANTTAQVELERVISRYGTSRFSDYCHLNRDLTVELLRDRIERIPDGRYSGRTFVEYDGHGDDQILEVRCSLRVEGTELHFDFSGDPEVDAFINSGYGASYGSVMTSIVPRLAYGDLPFNSGMWDPVHIDLGQPGTIINPTDRAPVSLGHGSTGSRITRLVTGVLAQAMSLSDDPTIRSRVSSQPADSTNLQGLYGVTDSGERTVLFYLDALVGSGGPAQTVGDGQDCYGMMTASGAGIPDVETHESRDPVVFLWRRLRENSAGPGTHRGGTALEVAYWLRDAERLTGMLSVNDPRLPAPGFGGGFTASAPQQYAIRHASVAEAMRSGADHASLASLGGEAEFGPSRNGQFELRRGDILISVGGGGSGLGDPLMRSAENVAKDFQAGFISAKNARAAYGVVLTESGAVDLPATEAERANIRRDRIGAVPSRIATPADEPGVPVMRTNIAGAWTWTCGYCDGSLSAATEDWRLVGTVCRPSPIVAAMEELEMAIRGRTAGEIIELREYFCPHCASCLSVDVLPEGQLQLSPDLTESGRAAAHA